MFFVIITCPTRHGFTYILFILKRAVVYGLSVCIHNHLTSIRFNSGDLVGRNTIDVFFWMMFGHRFFYLVVGFVYRNVIQYQKYLFDIDVIIFLVRSFYKIKELLSFCLLFVGVCLHHLIIGIII